MSAESEPASGDPRATTSEDSSATTPGDSGGESGTSSNAEPDGSSRIGHVLAVVLVGTLALGLLRPFYPTASALGLGAFLALFGVFVGVLALRERARGS